MEESLRTSVPVAATETAAYPRYRWVIIAQLWLHTLVFVPASALGVTLPDMREELAFGPLEAGWLGAARTLGMLAMLPASALLVHFNPHKAYAALLALISLGIFAVAWGPGFSVIFIGFVAYSIAASLSLIPNAFLRIQWVPPKEFATVMGIGMAASAMGQSLTLALIPVLLQFAGDWRVAYLILALLSLAAALGWVIWGREHITEAYQKSMAENRGLSAFKDALRRREFLLLGLAILGGATAYLNVLLFLPTYLSEERGLPLRAAGLVTGLMPLGGLFGTLLMGYAADRLGRRKITIWPFGLALPVLYWTILSPLPAIALAPVAFLLGFAAWAPFPAIQTMSFELPGVRPSEVAVGQSIMQTISTIGIIVGPVIAGALAEVSGSIGTGILGLSLLPLLLTVIPLALPETGPRGVRVP